MVSVQSKLEKGRLGCRSCSAVTIIGWQSRTRLSLTRATGTTDSCQHLSSSPGTWPIKCHFQPLTSTSVSSSWLSSKVVTWTRRHVVYFSSPIWLLGSKPHFKSQRLLDPSSNTMAIFAGQCPVVSRPWLHWVSDFLQVMGPKEAQEEQVFSQCSQQRQYSIHTSWALPLISTVEAKSQHRTESGLGFLLRLDR